MSKDMLKLTISSTAFLFILSAHQIVSAAPEKPFTPTDFPDSVSKIYMHTMQNGKVGVEAIQVKRVNEKHANPRYGRAWVSVQKNGKRIRCNYFADINPLGGAYGLYYPNKAMPSNYRCIV